MVPTSHIRLRPLSVTDRRVASVPIIRQKPLTQLAPRHKKSILASAQRLNRPIISQPTPRAPTTHKIDRFRRAGINRTLIIVGNGPSHKAAPLKELQDISQMDIMSINKPDDRLWPTTYWLFCDNTQYTRHRSLWEAYTGTIFNTPSVRDQKANSVRINSLSGSGFSTDLVKGVFIGRSSVYAAMQLGLWMGYDHIYVFGCDMTTVDGKLYPWGHNPDVADNIRQNRFKTEADFYQWAADNLSEDQRAKFSFCTRYNPWPFIKQFEQLDHMEATQIILDRLKTKIEYESSNS